MTREDRCSYRVEEDSPDKIGEALAVRPVIEEPLKNRESESSNVSLAKTSKWSSQPSAEEGEIMAQKKFLVTGATGTTGGCWSEDMRCGRWPIAKMTARNGWKR